MESPKQYLSQNLELPGLLQPVSRSKGRKCARLSAPSLRATVLVCFKRTMYGKHQPEPFTRTLNCQDCSNQFRDPRVESVLHYPPPPSAPLFWFVSKDPCMESPKQYLSQNLELPGLLQPVSRSKGRKCARLSAPSLRATVLVCFKRTMYGKHQPEPFTRTLNCQDGSNQFRDPRVESVLDYPPPPSAPLFWFVSKEPCMESPKQYLSQNLELPGLLQPVSRSKGRKCARLSAPSLRATVLVCFKRTMYGKHQPVPFTRTLNCQECSKQFGDPRVESVLDYPPPPSAPLFWFVSKEPCMESRNQYLSPEP